MRDRVQDTFKGSCIFDRTIYNTIIEVASPSLSSPMNVFSCRLPGIIISDEARKQKRFPPSASKGTDKKGDLERPETIGLGLGEGVCYAGRLVGVGARGGL